MEGINSIQRTGVATVQIPWQVCGETKLVTEYGGSTAAVTDTAVLAATTVNGQTRTLDETAAANFASGGAAAPRRWFYPGNGNFVNIKFAMAATNSGAAPNDVATVTLARAVLAGGFNNSAPCITKEVFFKALIRASAVVDAAPIPLSAAEIARYIPPDKQSLYWYWPAVIEQSLNADNNTRVVGSVPPYLECDFKGNPIVEVWESCNNAATGTTRGCEGIISLWRPL
jgi:hypothetical protein